MKRPIVLPFFVTPTSKCHENLQPWFVNLVGLQCERPHEDLQGSRGPNELSQPWCETQGQRVLDEWLGAGFWWILLEWLRALEWIIGLSWGKVFSGTPGFGPAKLIGASCQFSNDPGNGDAAWKFINIQWLWGWLPAVTFSTCQRLSELTACGLCIICSDKGNTSPRREDFERAFSSCRYHLVIKPSMENPLLMVWQGFWFEHVQKMEFQWIPSRIPHWREFIQHWIGTLYKTTPDFIKRHALL